MSTLKYMLACLIVVMSVPAAASACADVALVLAIDASGSIDDAEYAFQMRASADALESPEVASAIARAGTLSLAAVIWGDTAYGVQRLGWDRVTRPSELSRFAERLISLPRRVAGNTDIGAGLWAALDLLDEDAACAARRVVNVAGDGRESLYPRRREGVSLMQARKRAEAMQVTVNGLAIATDDPDLAHYYETRLITGPDAFTIEVRDEASVKRALIAKLVREIDTPIYSSIPDPVAVLDNAQLADLR